jgi:benzylsuccinate CoA-transferase BbsE subunit
VKAFDDLRVVELTGSVAGAWAGKLFADHGAQVLLLEPPGGEPARSAGEPARSVDEHGCGTGTLFAWLNTSKRSRVVDLSAQAGRGELERLLAGADVVVESSAPDPLRPRTLELDLPQLVKTYVSPFGLSGPYARFRSNEFTDDAIGGHLYLNGEPDREPITRPGQHSAYQAGTWAFIGAMAALWAREEIGRGQVVEVSHLEGLASMHQHTSVMWAARGTRSRACGTPSASIPARTGTWR